MEKLLNILNGDATLEKFLQTDLPGDVLVWREILSEGPVMAPGIGEFFSLRSAYLHGSVGVPHLEYTHKVVREFERLQYHSQYSEVILWFEYDLTDQVNLIFLLDFFNRNRGKNRLYLICPAEVPGYPNFKGIGELTPADLKKLKESRVELTAKELSVATRAWQAYCSGEESDIKAVLEMDTGLLEQLKPAFNAHLKRFPDSSGLNHIDRQLLQIVGSGKTDRFEVYREFSDANKIYGMADLAVYSYLTRLVERGLIQVPEN